MIRIYPTVFKGELTAPASKDHAQRLLFAASMPATHTLIENIPECDDVYTTMEILESLGCRLSMDENNNVLIEPFAKNLPIPTASFNFKKSATTSRFALAMASANGFKIDCKAGPVLSKRLLVPLVSRMAIRGVTFSSFSFPLEMNGRLEGGEYSFTGDEDAQFISALLMALPITNQDSIINIEGPLVESPFVEMTVSVLEQFGITISRRGGGFVIPGKQIYESPGKVRTEADWSLAAMWVAAAAACQQNGGYIKINGLSSSSPQRYRNIKPTLSMLAQDFTDMHVNASEFPNLTTLFAALASVKGNSFTIEGVPELRHKETDRLQATADSIKVLGADAEVTETGLHIIGHPERDYPEDTIIDCKDDPWIFMSFALAAAVLKKPIILNDEHCAEKVYKDFLKDYEALGGKFDIIK